MQFEVEDHLLAFQSERALKAITERIINGVKWAFWGQTPLRKNKLSKENIKGEQ